jgi:hypothetical protein
MSRVLTPQTLTQTYTTYSGCDIEAFIESSLIGNIQGVSFSVTREKAPVYVMGAADPVSFSRGKRGIAGSLIFTNFDRQALYDVMNNETLDLSYYRKAFDIAAGGRSYDLFSTKGVDASKSLEGERVIANYEDQIPPFTITLSASNEYGGSSWMAIFGVEILNAGAGLSIDDIVSETQYTFVARSLVSWQPKSKDANWKALADQALSKFENTAASRSINLASDLATGTTTGA